MTESELRVVYETYTGAWQLYKQFADVQDTEVYWSRLAQAAREYAKAHGKSGLAVDLAVVTIQALESKAGDPGAVVRQCKEAQVNQHNKQ